MDYKELLDLAIVAAERACVEILDVYRSGDFQAEEKGDRSPLTIADKRAHAVIVTGLGPSGLPVLSEEGADIPYTERSNWPLFWMVDPLDGTKEFLKRNDEFTVNIALIQAGQPVLGVVAVPVTDKLYYNIPGAGAYMRAGGHVTRLGARTRVDLKQPGLRVVASRSHLDDATLSFLSGLDRPELVSRGSSLKFMILAEGEADIYPRFGPTMEWDTAAAQAVVRGVGLRVCQAGSDEELTYNKPDLKNPAFQVW